MQLHGIGSHDVARYIRQLASSRSSSAGHTYWDAANIYLVWHWNVREALHTAPRVFEHQDIQFQLPEPQVQQVSLSVQQCCSPIHQHHGNLPQCKTHRTEQNLQGQEVCTDRGTATGKRTVGKIEVGSNSLMIQSSPNRLMNKVEYKNKPKWQRSRVWYGSHRDKDSGHNVRLSLRSC